MSDNPARVILDTATGCALWLVLLPLGLALLAMARVL
jgi:hypothetical protein